MRAFNTRARLPTRAFQRTCSAPLNRGALAAMIPFVRGAMAAFHEPPLERGIYAASTSNTARLVKRHKCRAPRFTVPVRDGCILEALHKPRSKSGAKAPAVQTLHDGRAAPEVREAFGLRAIHRRFVGTKRSLPVHGPDARLKLEVEAPQAMAASNSCSISLMMLTAILGALTGLSLLLTLWQWAASRRFPLHQRAAPPASHPASRSSSPCRGATRTRPAACEAGWNSITPAPVQILFDVASADDPVCATVRQLMAEHSERDAQLVICGEAFGANAKISTVVQLARLARHEVQVLSDADVRAPQDGLAHLVAVVARCEAAFGRCDVQQRVAEFEWVPCLVGSVWFMGDRCVLAGSRGVGG